MRLVVVVVVTPPDPRAGTIDSEALGDGSLTESAADPDLTWQLAACHREPGSLAVLSSTVTKAYLIDRLMASTQHFKFKSTRSDHDGTPRAGPHLSA